MTKLSCLAIVAILCCTFGYGDSTCTGNPGRVYLYIQPKDPGFNENGVGWMYKIETTDYSRTTPMDSIQPNKPIELDSLPIAQFTVTSCSRAVFYLNRIVGFWKEGLSPSQWYFVPVVEYGQFMAGVFEAINRANGYNL